MPTREEKERMRREALANYHREIQEVGERERKAKEPITAQADKEIDIALSAYHKEMDRIEALPDQPTTEPERAREAVTNVGGPGTSVPQPPEDRDVDAGGSSEDTRGDGEGRQPAATRRGKRAKTKPSTTTVQIPTSAEKGQR